MRESCIAHAPRGLITVIRQDYMELMHGDLVSAALLNEFEQLANAAIAADPKCWPNPHLGKLSLAYFSEALQGIGSDEDIQRGLDVLRKKRFINTLPDSNYQFRIPEVQDALEFDCAD